MTIQRSEVEALLATVEQLNKPNEGVIAELCRTWLAVQDAPVTPISSQIEPIRKPLSEIDWPDFRTTYARILPCDEEGGPVADTGPGDE